MKCPCFSNLEYTHCCKPFHDGIEIPQKPIALMRSRYAAYALNMPSYIIKTTHFKSSHFLADIATWKSEIESFSKEFNFVGLTILSEEEGPPLSYVTFKAHLEQDGEDCSFNEKSGFIYENDKWFFT